MQKYRSNVRYKEKFNHTKVHIMHFNTSCSISDTNCKAQEGLVFPFCHTEMAEG